MKKGLGAFRNIPLLDVEEKVESIACTGDAIYAGTAQGNLFQFDIGWTAAPEDFASSAKKRTSVRLASRRPVEQVFASGELVFALADGSLTVLPADLSKTSTGQVMCREVKRFCLHTGIEQDGQNRKYEVCVSSKKKITLYQHNGKAFESKHEFPTNEAASALVWHQSWVCVGERRQYILYSERIGVPRDICQIDGKFPPQIAVLPNNELMLLIQESVGIFYNLNLQQPASSPKQPVTWPRKIVSLGAAGNYVFGSTGNGQIDVFGIRDQKNIQTLTLDGATAAMTNVGGRLLVATEASLTCLDPIPFERQVQKLLQQVRVSDALGLLNANFCPEDPKREEQLSRFHALAGWALFRDLQFLQAFQHFLYTPDLNIARVLVFWRKHLPSGWDASAASRSPSVKALDEKAPEPCDIEDFVRQRLEERQSEGGGSSSSAGVSANLDMANAAMASFLLKQREALRAQERLPLEQRIAGLSGSSADMGQLLRAVDTLLLKLLIEADTDDLRLQEVLDAGVACTIEDCERFLRDRQRLDVLARLWKARGMYDLVLEEWSRLLAGSGESATTSEPRKATGNTRSTKAQAIAEMSDALRGAAGNPGSADLLRRYVPELLAVEPSSVLPIFTQSPGQCALKVDEVLQLLKNHNDLVLGYLEYAVESRTGAEVRHRSQLGLLYAAQVEEDLQAGRMLRVEQSTARRKLLRFLETTKDLDVHALLPKIEALDLHEECVVLYSIAQRHLDALRILVVKLDDNARAEIYCRIVMARTHRLPAAVAVAATNEATVPPSPSELSVLCADPPEWAKGIAFGAKKTTPQSGSQDDEQEFVAPAAVDDIQENAVENPRPLMLFLKVLLDASTGAVEKPGDFLRTATSFQESAVTLLTVYAGHQDLPPCEVIGILPSSWTLSSLSGYLSRSARACLHERRSSMLEENLSSMAYLKTFSTWAEARKRKVQVTGDKCCPVCNRRFVDKDSMGKAFVAYPNGTCVHINCKEDIHICPKTGRNFKENFSISCHALGMDLVE